MTVYPVPARPRQTPQAAALLAKPPFSHLASETRDGQTAPQNQLFNLSPVALGLPFYPNSHLPLFFLSYSPLAIPNTHSPKSSRPVAATPLIPSLLPRRTSRPIRPRNYFDDLARPTKGPNGITKDKRNRALRTTHPRDFSTLPRRLRSALFKDAVF